MKFLFMLVLLLNTQVFANTSLVGTWKFTAYIYNGQTLPIPNPDLDLRFVFYSNGYSRLRWFRLGEEGFCERKAKYEITNHVLHQKNIWINPNNDRSCAGDSEMRPNAETFTSFRVIDRLMYLELALDDKAFVYVFTFLPDESDFGNGQ
jgi:hypothetical protein